MKKLIVVMLLIGIPFWLVVEFFKWVFGGF